MKIGTKLVSGFLIVALLIVVVGYIGVSSNRNVHGEFDKLAEQTLPAIKVLEGLKFSGLRIVASTSEFGFIKAEGGAAIEQEELELIKEGMENFDASLRQYEDFIIKFFLDEKEFLGKIKAAGQEMKEKSNKIVELKQRGASGTEVLEAKEELEAAEQAFLDAVGEAIGHETKELEERQMEVNASLKTTQNAIYFTSALTLLIAVMVGLFTSRSISSPVTRLTKAINDISTGQLDVEVKGKERSDEVGDLARAFDRTVVSLKLAMKKAKPEEKEEKKK